MHIVPFAKKLPHWYPNGLHHRSWHCRLKLFLSRSEALAQPQLHGIHVCRWEGLQTGLALHNASYGQIHLSLMTLHDQSWRTCRWEVHQRPAIPKAEGIGEFPFVQVKFFVTVYQLGAPFIFARLFALNCSGLIFFHSSCRMVLFSSSLVLAIFLLEVLSCSA